MTRRIAVPYHCYSDQVRSYLFHQLQPLAALFGREEREPCDVAAGMRQARYITVEIADLQAAMLVRGNGLNYVIPVDSKSTRLCLRISLRPCCEASALWSLDRHQCFFPAAQLT